MDDDTTSTTGTTALEADSVDETTTGDDPRLAKARKDAAGYRTRLRDAESRLAEFEKAEQAKAEADKSEAEKRAAAEERANAAELRALKLEVASEKGLTAAQAKRLHGATREELDADADEILSLFPSAAPAPAGPKKPKADPSQGARGGDAAKTASVSSGAALYAERHTKTST